MRKILCVILAALMMASSLCIMVGAASENSPSVLEELNTLKINGVPFSEANYPLVPEQSGLQMITAAERGFSSLTSSPDFAFYLYLYNPSGMELADSTMNSVQMGLSKECESAEYFYFGLKMLSKTDDNRFVKYKIVTSMYNPADRLYKRQNSAGTRIYNIVSFRLLENGQLVSYPVKRTFSFSGYEDSGSLSCSSFELETLDVKLETTNWISPNAGEFVDSADGTSLEPLRKIYNHYELNTAYFTLPRKYVDKTVYDAVESIRAAFSRMRTTPILIAKDGVLSDETINAIEKATYVNHRDEEDVSVENLVSTLLKVGLLVQAPATNIVDWIYTDSTLAYNAMTTFGLNMSGTLRNRLSYVFEVEDLPVTAEDFKTGDMCKMAVSAEELEAYFYERYNDPNFNNAYLYTDYEYQEIDYTDKVYDMKTYKSLLDTNIEQWVLKLGTGMGEDSYLYSDFNLDCSMFEVIEDPSVYANYEVMDKATVANRLYIGVNDVESFSATCKNAAANDEVVVLLRFGFSDYSCIPVYKYNDLGVSWGWTEPIGYSIEKWIYKDVNVLSLTFSKDGKSVTVPVASNTVDSFGDMGVFEPPVGLGGGIVSGIVEGWDKVLSALKIALIVIAVVAVVVFSVCIYNRVKEDRNVKKIANALPKDHSDTRQKKRKRN